ncbi:MAG: hypothetical protein Ct9H300mP16_10280 [Pseudomonadota bacterium]|nr:MAG: hypothetical protein Ct9H300mP16_10280 [Pseudomonadota bacterium]
MRFMKATLLRPFCVNTVSWRPAEFRGPSRLSGQGSADGYTYVLFRRTKRSYPQLWRLVTGPDDARGSLDLGQCRSAPLGYGSDAYFHAIAEALKLTLADREAYLGDPDFVDVPLER